jgi:hypothetical protein
VNRMADRFLARFRVGLVVFRVQGRNRNMALDGNKVRPSRPRRSIRPCANRRRRLALVQDGAGTVLRGSEFGLRDRYPCNNEPDLWPGSKPYLSIEQSPGRA